MIKVTTKMNAEYLGFWVDSNREKLLKRSEPRFAFVGRSNVGKSSLINSILKSKNLARVSRQPGKTRDIHFFLWNKEAIILADLPGYGFAKVSNSERKRWVETIQEYMENDSGLLKVLVLMDARHAPTREDEQALEYFHPDQVAIVLTKFDALKNQKERAKRKKEVESKFPSRELHWVSAKEGTGIKELCGWLKKERL